MRGDSPCVMVEPSVGKERALEKLHQYEASVRWTGNRHGEVESPGLPSLTVGSPPDFGGEGGVWTPENFLVASTNACVMLTFLVIAQFSKLEIAGWSSKARGTVEKVEGKGYVFTGIEIDAEVRVASEADVDRAERLVRKAESSCLVSKSLEPPVKVNAHITAEGI